MKCVKLFTALFAMLTGLYTIVHGHVLIGSYALFAAYIWLLAVLTKWENHNSAAVSPLTPAEFYRLKQKEQMARRKLKPAHPKCNYCKNDPAIYLTSGVIQINGLEEPDGTKLFYYNDFQHALFNDDLPQAQTFHVNPATGLPMIGGTGSIDVAGNPYGIDTHLFENSSVDEQSHLDSNFDSSFERSF